MIDLTILLMFFVAASATPAPTRAADASFKRDLGAQGYGSKHSGDANFDVVFSNADNCSAYGNANYPWVETPLQFAMTWDVPYQPTAGFVWIALVKDGTGYLDVSTGSNCETFVEQFKPEQLNTGACFDVSGWCLHYWSP